MASVTMDMLFGKTAQSTVTVALGFGKAAFPRASCTVAMLQVEAPFVRSLATKKLSRKGMQATISSGKLSMDGAFYAGSYEVPEGTILFVQANQTRGGNRIADAVIPLRVRAKGPFISVLAHLPRDARNLIGDSICVFDGRADVLTLEELQALGIEPSPGYINGYMNPEEVEECFMVSVLQPEIEAAPTVVIVTNSSGEAVALKSTAVRRRMRIRKSS